MSNEFQLKFKLLNFKFQFLFLQIDLAKYHWKKSSSSSKRRHKRKSIEILDSEKSEIANILSEKSDKNLMKKNLLSENEVGDKENVKKELEECLEVIENDKGQKALVQNSVSG